MTSPERVVTIAGVGALGSHVCQLIRNLPVDVKLIDFDKVSQANLASQFHGKPSVGKNKAEALRQTMDFLWKRKATAVPHKLTVDNMDTLLRSSDIVLDALDNGAGRRMIQGYVRKHSIPCLHGGLAVGGAYAIVRWDKDFTIDDEPSPGASTAPCEDGNFLPMIAVTAAFMAQSVRTFVETGKYVGYNISPVGVTRVS